MKVVGWSWLAVLVLIGLNPIWAFALSGEDLMKKVVTIRSWKDETARVSFILIDKRGRRLVRKVLRRRKNYGGKGGLNTKTLLTFLYPPKYRNYAYLSWSFTDIRRRDHKWIYYPNNPFYFKAIMRLGYNPREGFLRFWLEGNDFTYADLTERPPEADTHRFLRQETYDSVACFVIESTPKTEAYHGKERRITWISQSDYLPLKVMIFDPEGLPERTIQNRWVRHQGFWTLKESKIKNHKRRHQTLMLVEEVRYNSSLSEIYFSPHFLTVER